MKNLHIISFHLVQFCQCNGCSFQRREECCRKTEDKEEIEYEKISSPRMGIREELMKELKTQKKEVQ